MKILVMGLPGAGKTWLAERLSKFLCQDPSISCAWYNADKVRQMANDWDFSPAGRIRQANRMKTFADYEVLHGRWVICDFVAPTEKARTDFGADYCIWLNTITEGRFEDTNKMFQSPLHVDHVVEQFYTDEEIAALAETIKAEWIIKHSRSAL